MRFTNVSNNAVGLCTNSLNRDILMFYLRNNYRHNINYVEIPIKI